MHVACFSGSFECVKYLFENLGTYCLIEKDNGNKTCLDNAINSGNKKIIIWLESKFVDCLWESIKLNNLNEIEKLFESVDIDSFDFISPQMIHFAVEKGMKEILELLLKFGGTSFIEKPDKNGNSGLEIICNNQKQNKKLQKNYEDTLRLLLNKGARVSFNEKGRTIEEVTGKNKHLRGILLDVPSNQMFISSLYLQNVKEIDLSDSFINTVPQSIYLFKNLNRLNLARNSLEALPSFFADMELWNANEKYDWTVGNPLSTIPNEILDSFKKKKDGFQQMKDYLKGLEGLKEMWNNVKLVVVGKEGVGLFTDIYFLKLM